MARSRRRYRPRRYRYRTRRYRGARRRFMRRRRPLGRRTRRSLQRQTLTVWRKIDAHIDYLPADYKFHYFHPQVDQVPDWSYLKDQWREYKVTKLMFRFKLAGARGDDNSAYGPTLTAWTNAERTMYRGTEIPKIGFCPDRDGYQQYTTWDTMSTHPGFKHYEFRPGRVYGMSMFPAKLAPVYGNMVGAWGWTPNMRPISTEYDTAQHYGLTCCIFNDTGDVWTNCPYRYEHWMKIRFYGPKIQRPGREIGSIYTAPGDPDEEIEEPEEEPAQLADVTTKPDVTTDADVTDPTEELDMAIPVPVPATAPALVDAPTGD